MRVQVGPWEYRVRLVRGYVQYQGEPCFGLCDHLKREILIADVLDRGQRLHVFVHELVHAWWHYCPGDVRDEEAVADLMALAMSRVLMQVAVDRNWLKLFDQVKGDGVAPLDPPPPPPPPPPEFSPPEGLSLEGASPEGLLLEGSSSEGVPPKGLPLEGLPGEAGATLPGAKIPGAGAPLVQRKVLPGDGEGEPGWVIRVFQNPSADDRGTGASDD